MAIINYAAREMTAKIVYYGPGLSGKTTSIQYIHSKISPTNKGKLVSLATETDRTLFFDFFPVDFGQIGGFKVKFNFYTVPGQVFYNTTRKLVLKGADGVVFVADSQEGMKEQNAESLDNLKENLTLHGLDPETIPFVIQYNKRDIPGAMPLDMMRRDVNKRNVPDFETNAVTGDGVMEAMKAICKMVLEDLRRKQSSPQPKASTRPAPPPPPPQADAAPKPAPQAAAEKPKVEEKPVAKAQQKPTGPAKIQETSAAPVERTAVIPVEGIGTQQTSVSVPLTLNIAENVTGVKIDVSVTVTYLSMEGSTVEVGQISAGQAQTVTTQAQAPQPEKKKGLLARLFGGG